jgi:putative oxidoreductase
MTTTMERTTSGGRTVTTTSRIDRDAVARDFGLLALRVAAGLVLAGHGAQKLFGWWEGPGIDKLAESLADQGFTPGRFFAYLLGCSEFFGGLLLALGLLTPLAAAAVIGVMYSAVVHVHWDKGVWASNGGFELPLLIGVAALAVAFTGPGRLSLDRNWSWSAGGLVPGVVALATGLAAGLIVMVIKAA